MGDSYRLNRPETDDLKRMLKALYQTRKAQMQESKHSDCAVYMGFPPETALICTGMHGIKATCTTCRWNFCQGCLRPCHIICIRCNEVECPGCASEPKFWGWSGICHFCKARGHRAPNESIEDEPMCPLVHTVSDICTICKWNCCIHCGKLRRTRYDIHRSVTPHSDCAASRTGGRDYDCNCTGSFPVVELLAPTPPTSPRALNPGDFWGARTADEEEKFRREWVTDPVEYQRVKDTLEEGLARGRGMASVLSGYDTKILDYTVYLASIFRYENPVLMECFRSAERKMVFDNSKRPEAARFQGRPVKIAFHGTDPKTARIIAEMGFKLQFNEKNAYGLGIYTDSNGQIAMEHSKPGEFGPSSILLCHVLQGKKALTDRTARGAPAGFDSGGDGDAGWITCSFENFQVYPSYEINFFKVRVAGGI